MIHIHTNYGLIVLALDSQKAPKTVANFETYIREGFYDGTLFHRVIDGFMIQGGGFTTDMKQKTTHSPINNEAQNGLRNEAGTIAMARTNHPHSATSQFFINVANNDFLNHTGTTETGWGYCVFGKVTEGMETVEKIKGVPTHTKDGHQNVPISDVIIQKIEIIS